MLVGWLRRPLPLREVVGSKSLRHGGLDAGWWRWFFIHLAINQRIPQFCFALLAMPAEWCVSPGVHVVFFYGGVSVLLVCLAVLFYLALLGVSFVSCLCFWCSCAHDDQFQRM